MEDLFRTLPKILESSSDLEPLREPMVFGAWKRIAGDSLVKHTQPVKLDGKRLRIAVTDEIWRKHLESLSGQMIFKLNNLLAAEVVTFLEFVVDAGRFTEQRRRQEQTEQEKRDFEERSRGEITPKLRMVADSIEDDELRELFLQAAGNCLVRKKDLAL